MKKSRELTSHTYDEETAGKIANDIMDSFYNAFEVLKTRLEEERCGRQSNLFKE